MDFFKELIVDVPDFPKPGIVFKDITPLIENPKAFGKLIDTLAEKVPEEVESFLAIESRGFILGAALANKLKRSLVLVRKPGKLPREVYSVSYQLEYGKDGLEVHKDQLNAGLKALLIDDVLATGGTARAVEQLCEQADATLLGHLFLMELRVLKGREALTKPVERILSY